MKRLQTLAAIVVVFGVVAMTTPLFATGTHSLKSSAQIISANSESTVTVSDFLQALNFQLRSWLGLPAVSFGWNNSRLNGPSNLSYDPKTRIQTTMRDNGGDVATRSTDPKRRLQSTMRDKGGDIATSPTDPYRRLQTTMREKGGDVATTSTDPNRHLQTTLQDTGGEGAEK